MASYASYRALIADAIVKLKDRTPGSTACSIKKHMEANMSEDEMMINSVFRDALKKMVAEGELSQAGECYMFNEKFLANGKKKSASADGTDTKKAAVSSGCIRLVNANQSLIFEFDAG